MAAHRVGSLIATVASSSIQALTAEQMREVDRVAVEQLGLLLIQMMENAGARLAELALARFGPGTAVVLAGRGGNGGGGLVAARHLVNRGVRVQVTLAEGPDRLAEVPRHQLRTLEQMGVPIAFRPIEADLVLDALLGYALRGDPHGGATRLIRWANEQGAPVCALDVPSGLEASTGRVGDPCVRATATLTLALPKTGLGAAPHVVGELYLADIGVPDAGCAKIGVTVGPIFRPSAILRLV
ncbi:MAG TPA: NAD(P)H-hydrate epimerase [Actinomycetota bacterium]|nr:NAD(P)H-hydrate epimerase [Actinomycetota bacterium]